MANFVASIKDVNNNPAITSDGSVIGIYDYSNYDTNTEQGHAQAYFTEFRKIKFINPDGTSYLLSSLGDGDELISAAAGNTLPIHDIYNYTTGDGVYTVILYTLPTWTGDAWYNLSTTPYVYYNGIIYKALQNSNSKQPDIETEYWESVSDINDLPAKYKVTQKFSVKCALLICFANKVKLANCSSTNIGCNWNETSKDKIMSDAIRLSLIIDGIEQMVNAGMWSEAINLINLGKNICCCNS